VFGGAESKFLVCSGVFKLILGVFGVKNANFWPD